MKTASFVLEESHIDWIEAERRRQGNTSASAIIRRLVSNEMAREQEVIESKSRQESQEEPK